METCKVREALLRALDEMEKKAREINIKGVGVAAFLDAGETVNWIGEMKVVDTPTNPEAKPDGCNLVAIAWSKAGEIIASGQHSGTPGRHLMVGELGFTGGAYGEYNGCKLSFAFSGGTSEEDFQVSLYGIEAFKKLI